ncbi:MAG: 30S ribosome-binding factor RbfA [bacterium]|nr:30S ribosome-binding factor RbfA [bacterium]
MTRRTQKVASLIKADVAQAIEDTIKLPDTIVSVTEVEVSPDLKEAIVWLSIYGKNEDQARETVSESHAQIQKFVASKSRTKFTPKLQFRFDTSAGYADKINQLIKKIK